MKQTNKTNNIINDLKSGEYTRQELADKWECHANNITNIKSRYEISIPYKSNKQTKIKTNKQTTFDNYEKWAEFEKMEKSQLILLLKKTKNAFFRLNQSYNQLEKELSNTKKKLRETLTSRPKSDSRDTALELIVNGIAQAPEKYKLRALYYQLTGSTTNHNCNFYRNKIKEAVEAW